MDHVLRGGRFACVRRKNFSQFLSHESIFLIQYLANPTLFVEQRRAKDRHDGETRARRTSCRRGLNGDGAREEAVPLTKGRAGSSDRVSGTRVRLGVRRARIPHGAGCKPQLRRRNSEHEGRRRRRPARIGGEGARRLDRRCPQDAPSVALGAHNGPMARPAIPCRRRGGHDMCAAQAQQRAVRRLDTRLPVMAPRSRSGAHPWGRWGVLVGATSSGADHRGGRCERVGGRAPLASPRRTGFVRTPSVGRGG